LPEKLTKIPEFYMIFARKMPEFFIIIALKYFSRTIGARAPLCPPVSYTYEEENTVNATIVFFMIINSV